MVFKKIFLFIFIIAVLGIILFFWGTKQKNNLGGNFVIINNHKIKVEIADTVSKQIQGLSGQINLPENNGMLFIFSQKQYQVFWMKDMKFPIDIVWVKDNRVVGFVENAPAPMPSATDDQLERYASPEAVDKVLEINTGLVKKWGIKTGDKIY